MSAKEFLATLAMLGEDILAWEGREHARGAWPLALGCMGRTPETASEHAGEFSAGYTLTRPPLPPAELVDHYARIFGNRERAQATAEAVIRHARRQTTMAGAR